MLQGLVMLKVVVVGLSQREEAHRIAYVILLG